MKSASSTWLLAVLVLLTSACASPPRQAETHRLPADGRYLRHERVRIAPAHTQAFEALLTRCAAVADEQRLPRAFDWRCYRESPGRYWLVSSADDADGFAYARADDPLRAFVRTIGERGGAALCAELERALDAIEREHEWTLTLRRTSAWSTTGARDLDAFPAARLILRGVRPGREADFAAAVAARTEFLAAHGYRLPIEGYVVLQGAPGTAIQVVRAPDWAAFHSSESFGAFVRGLSDAEQAAYARRKAALMETMASAEYHDALYLAASSRGR